MSAREYLLLLDTNSWVAERLLQSTVGSAILYALTQTNGGIALPEVVELEANAVLLEKGEEAIEAIRKGIQLLKQLSGHQMGAVGVPTEKAIREGIERRLADLGGQLQRVPFTEKHARGALQRILKKAPPCGMNNEQFRDCCIWEAACELAGDRPIHLVTDDGAFYEGRNKTLGLANVLRDELATGSLDIRIYPSLQKFLDSLDRTATTIDKEAIAAAIVKAAFPAAAMVAFEGKDIELGEAYATEIKGYATPAAGQVAIAFSVSFPVKQRETAGGDERVSNSNLRVEGIASYDPAKKAVSDVEIREWSHRVNDHRTDSWRDPAGFERQWRAGQIRFL